MPEPDGLWWLEQRKLDRDAGLDWLEDLEEETRRLVEDDSRRYGPPPWPRAADEARVLDLHGDEEAA